MWGTVPWCPRTLPVQSRMVLRVAIPTVTADTGKPAPLKRHITALREAFAACSRGREAGGLLGGRCRLRVWLRAIQQDGSSHTLAEAHYTHQCMEIAAHSG